jgi:hypothetical protein
MSPDARKIKLLGVAFSAIIGWVEVTTVSAVQTGDDRSRPLIEGPRGFWITPSDYSGKLYGSSSPVANWSVVQWGIPADLPSFRGRLTENEFARVELLPQRGYVLEQNGRGLPCDKPFRSGRTLVNEFDLFMQPNTADNPAQPAAIRRPERSLASFQKIYYSVKAGIIEVELIDSDCKTTQLAVDAAIVLHDKWKKQTLFYQLRLGSLRSENGRLFQTELPAAWFFTGENLQTGHANEFGYDDNVATFGKEPLKPGTARNYRFDLLPRLAALIQVGAEFGADQDLAHWAVSGAYHGEIIWGHLRARTSWSGFSLTASP